MTHSHIVRFLHRDDGGKRDNPAFHGEDELTINSWQDMEVWGRGSIWFWCLISWDHCESPLSFSCNHPPKPSRPPFQKIRQLWDILTFSELVMIPKEGHFVSFIVKARLFLKFRYWIFLSLIWTAVCWLWEQGVISYHFCLSVWRSYNHTKYIV